jgi:hypothetical protein
MPLPPSEVGPKMIDVTSKRCNLCRASHHSVLVRLHTPFHCGSFSNRTRSTSSKSKPVSSSKQTSKKTGYQYIIRSIGPSDYEYHQYKYLLPCLLPYDDETQTELDEIIEGIGFEDARPSIARMRASIAAKMDGLHVHVAAAGAGGGGVGCGVRGVLARAGGWFLVKHEGEARATCRKGVAGKGDGWREPEKVRWVG